MRYIDWNIKCYCNIDKIIEYLDTQISLTECIIALQEVMPEKALVLKQHYGNGFTVSYSYDYRPADPQFDTDNRRLGVMLLISKDMSVTDTGIFSRCLFPERTLFATINISGKEYRIITFHSITGVSFKMGKAVQYRSFAESIRDYRPDIVSMDANEPEKDSLIMSEIKFFDQGDSGKGAKVFFDELQKEGLCDALAKSGNQLTYSHILPNGAKRRYDFIFVKEGIAVKSMSYNYESAAAATSDHSILIAELF